MRFIKDQFVCAKVGKDDGKHYFFGYYNKSNWDKTGKFFLGNQVPWADAVLDPNLNAKVGYFDLTLGEVFVEVADTKAWNWQMGCQLQWLDDLPGKKMIYNVRTDNENGQFPFFGSEIFDIESGEKQSLPLPIYVVAPDNRWALSINYRRLYLTHKTIGYSSASDHEKFSNYPSNDGIYWMDLSSGVHKLIINYESLRKFHPVSSMENAIHWVSHIEVNPSSSRVLFLHRWTERVEDETCFLHRLITMNPDGSDMFLLECSDHPLPHLYENFDPTVVGTFEYEKSEYQISHPMWRNNSEIIVWGPHNNKIHYHLYQDKHQNPVQIIGQDVLVENGHMSFSPSNDRWMISDTYPNDQTHKRILFLYDLELKKRYNIGEFYADPTLSKENRCDLHPRWRRDGLAVSIDSIHELDRRIYIIDVSMITK
jgi:hypothetical protein